MLGCGYALRKVLRFSCAANVADVTLGMNKEVGYIGRGFLLMLVVLAGFGIVHFLSSTGRPPTADDTASNYITITEDHGAPRVYNARGKVFV